MKKLNEAISILGFGKVEKMWSIMFGEMLALKTGAKGRKVE